MRCAQPVVHAQRDLVGGEPAGAVLTLVAEDNAHGVLRGRCREDTPYVLVLEERRVNVVEQQARDVGLLLHDFFVLVCH
ncbi:hypothetical protein Scani_75960 [Streptomyces caniferus]|uniref:Uncharacterized protein n=1 Tax=Streptomyces caniferus TaxID=285557 RepID=A0A640SJQ9_9ACTN|nr:hypothetical protein Scani_75960 [Streptomyces caniferus]